MTQEQYNRAVEISKRLEELEEVNKEIECASQRRLCYIRDSDHPCSEWKMRNIGSILDKHDLMIRDEINAEIESLKVEILTL